MLRFNNIKFITVFSISLLVFTACSKKDDTTVTPSDNIQQINQWIYDTMSDAYYWFDQLPAISTLTLTDASDDFFEKLVYQRSSVDRFSMVTDDVDELAKSLMVFLKFLVFVTCLVIWTIPKLTLALF
jgi:hypothetical protein